jgi:hypothetical protein
MYRIVYNRKGGDMLYIFEVDPKKDPENGKFYFSQIGYEIFCK